jgi:ferredoxin-NADP reductase/CRP-like cAMP-binding protein
MVNAPQEQSIRCALPTLKSLTEEKRQALFARATALHVKRDEVIFEEGDIGHSMYFIKSGAVRVLTTTEDGQPIILASLKIGECFGEKAVLAGRTEGKRQNSAIATEPTQLLQIALADLQSIAPKNSFLESQLQTMTDDKIHSEREKKSAQLNTSSILDSGGMEWQEEEEFEAGEIVFKEGDVGDRFYLILQGVAKITKKEGRTEKLVSRLNRGQYFGERALIRNEPRDVTVSAEGKLRVNSYKGAITHKASQFSLMDNLTTLYQVPKDIKPGEPIAYKHYGVDELSFQIGPLVGITAFGEWPDVGHVDGSTTPTGEAEYVRHDLIKESSLFRTLPVGKKSVVCRVECLEELQFDDGSVIFREGDVADRFYLILSGKAKVTKKEDYGEKLVARLCRGQYFGEVALIRNEPRIVTVTAEGPIRLASFKVLITFHTSKFMDMDSLTTMYHFVGGEKVISTKVVNQPIFDATRMAAMASYVSPIIYKRAGVRRELFYLYGRLVGMTSIGEWPDLGRVHQLIIQNKRVWPWQLALFKKKGVLWLEQERKSFKANAMVCKCTGATRGVLNQAVADDCDTVEKLVERTGASQVCGSCVSSLAEIVGRPDMAPVDLVSVLPVTTEVKSFRFRPRYTQVFPHLPGQHIRIEGQIAGYWVQRSYILTSPVGQANYYEITVKREEHGLFSRWLHDELNINSSVRISKPQGDFYLPLDEQTPIVCFSGGIGITPSLAILRTLHNMNHERALYIDYSVRTNDKFVYHHEFMDVSSQRDNISVNLRATREENVIQAEELEQIAENYPDATFYICGPQAFEKALCTHLEAASVPADKIKRERFVPAGGSAAALPKLEGAKTLLIGSLVTFFVALLFMTLEAIPFSDSVEIPWQIDRLWTDNVLKQVTGYSILALTIIGMTLSFRKRLQNFRMGNFAWWRIMHLIMGLLALALLFIHTGMNAEKHVNFFNFLLMVSFLGALIIGSVVGVVTFIESRFPKVTMVYHVKTWLQNAHIVIFLPLPVLIAVHIVLVYDF